MFLVGYSENIANSPKAPTGVPFSEAPCAWAASSNSNSECESAMVRSVSILAGWPYK